MLEDLEEKLARITQLAARKQEQADALRGQLAGLRVTRQSPDGLLSATVTANGQLVDLRIDDRALRNGRQLAANLLALVFQASTAAARQVQELAAPLLQDSSVDPAQLGIAPTPPVVHGPPPPPPPQAQHPTQPVYPPQAPYSPPPAQPAPPTQPVQPPPTRRPPVDDDQEEGGSFLRPASW